MSTTETVHPSQLWGVRPDAPRAVRVEAIEHTIRHTTLRGVGFIGLLAVGLIHLLDVVSKFHETPYLGAMYVGLMISAAIVAFALLHTGRPLAWAAGGLLALATLTGFVLSRTTGLPGATGDIGNWKEPLGLASMFVEVAVIALSAYALAIARRERRPGIHESVPVGSDAAAPLP